MIICVTGLPRSGTTMMMRMLEAGGIPLYYDRDMPFEFKRNGVEYINYSILLRETSKINDLRAGDGSWLKECEGMAVKILSPSKIPPPRGYNYKFIWMDRNAKHVANSNRKYLAREKREVGMPSRDMIGIASEEREKGIRMLKGYPDSHLIVIRFEEVITKPVAVATRVSAYLNTDLDLRAMANVVVPRAAHCMPDMMEERIYQQHTHLPGNGMESHLPA